jgi:hypothetical protein
MKMHRKPSNGPRLDTTPDRTGAPESRPLSNEDAQLLSQILEIAGSVRARELRVDEVRGLETTRGQTTVRRVGLPATGAVEGVTYHNVQVDVSVQGRPGSKKP